MKSRNYNAVIVGAGAAGLMCAISAKQKNPKLKIAIIEKNDRVGKKLLSTGNGRCNLSNRDISTNRYCGSFARQSGRIFEKYSHDYLIGIFSELGLMTCTDSENRIYPLCRQASAVLDVLRFACERLDVDIFCSENIKSIGKQSNGFVIKTDNNSFISDKLVIACGSKAAPKLGGNASAGDYLRNFGHTFLPFSPALCPVKVKSDILKSLKGIRCACNAVLTDKNGDAVKTEKGEVQFTDSALSGICIFNLSLYTKKGSSITLDLLPDISEFELFNILIKQKELFSKLSSENLFTGILQKRLTMAILKLSGVREFSKLCGELSEKELRSICKTAKAMKFEALENSGFEQAQCSLGGVKGSEIDENSMQSRIVKGLYIAGEAIDICGECGGYNLHFAFSSGHLAGENL